MSGKHIKQTSKNYEETLNQLILLFKSQQLCVKKKSPVEEPKKRLNNDFNIVDGRKLDQEKCKLKSKLFGHAPINRHNKGITSKNSGQIAAGSKELGNNEEMTKILQEQLKNFTFTFSKESKAIVSVNLNKLSKVTNETMVNGKQCNVLKDTNIKAQAVIDKKKQCQVPPYKKDHMYFVLDTNVLIECLHLLDNVADLILFRTSGSVLYVPYMVIKELDMLKCKQTTSYAARRAIEYLNDKFDDQENIEAQSALEDAQHLIDIDSQDDSIINCCLQLKSELEHMMLLTNDNNLRLKAHASSIRVSTCYQLTSCKGNWWSVNRDRREQQRRQRYNAWY